jgi:hypothetical protein
MFPISEARAIQTFVSQKMACRPPAAGLGVRASTRSSAMKIRTPLSLATALFVVFTILVSAPFAGAQQSPANDGSMLPGDVVITSFNGDVKITTKNKPDGMAPETGKIIRQGAKIMTGNDSEIMLAFSNGTSIQVGANSKFFIDEYLQTPWDFEAGVWKGAEREPTKSKLVMSLDEGDLIASVKKLNSKSVMNVVTPLGTAGIRGTHFVISVIPANTPGGRPTVRLGVTQGNVDFTPSQGGQPTNVPAGNEGIFNQNEARDDGTPGDFVAQLLQIEEQEFNQVEEVVQQLQEASETAAEALQNAGGNLLDPTDQGDAEDGANEEATGGVDTPDVTTPPVVPPPPPSPTPVPSNF